MNILTVSCESRLTRCGDDDLTVTSLNWASASSDADLPEGDVGARIRLTGIARNAIVILQQIHREMIKEEARGRSAPDI